MQKPYSSWDVFFIAGSLLVGGGFVLQLAGTDPSLPINPEAGSLTSQLVLGTIYTIAMIAILREPRSLASLLQAWPLLLFPCLALASTAWSADAFLSFRRAIALLGTILFGLSLGFRYPVRQLISLLGKVLFLGMAISIVFVIFLNRYGVHQLQEPEAIHAGLWRGMFAHRNTLGQ